MGTLNIDIKVQQEPVKKCFVFPKEFAESFDLYVQLATQEYSGVNETEVAMAMMAAHMKRDKYFQSHLKKLRVNNGRKRRKEAITDELQSEKREVA